jgi:mycofactocin precursor
MDESVTSVDEVVVERAAAPDELVAAELDGDVLVEEVSIDGMCGVY